MDFVDPKIAVQKMKLKRGMKVGDFGAGSGHYSIAAATLVGSEGRVYSIDVQEDVLKHLNYIAEQRKLENIETVWGDFEKAFGTKLRDNVFDAAILSNVLFQLEDRSTAIIEIKRTLKSGGTLLVIDWSGAHGGIGPDVDKIIPEDVAEKLFIDAGFQKTISFSPGPHHYGMILSAP